MKNAQKIEFIPMSLEDMKKANDAWKKTQGDRKMIAEAIRMEDTLRYLPIVHNED